MNLKHGEHQSRNLKNGVVGYFVRKPRSRVWGISFADNSWIDPSLTMFYVKTWSAQKLGCEKLVFKTLDDAGAFIECRLGISAA